MTDIKVTVIPVEEIIIHNLDILTIEQFLSTHHRMDSYSWCGGYLMTFTFFGDDTMDKAQLENKWMYKAVDIAPMKEYADMIQSRFVKTPVFDLTGNQIMMAVAKHMDTITGSK